MDMASIDINEHDPAIAADPYAAERDRIAHGLCDDALAQPSVLLLEQWASIHFGTMWTQRRRVTRYCGDADPMLALGLRILDSILAVERPDAGVALAALGRIARGELGERLRACAEELERPEPALAAGVGTTRLTRAFRAAREGDGEVLLFATDAVDPCAHMLVVYVDARSGGIAKHLRLLSPLNPLDPEHAARYPSLRFDPASLSVCRERARRAIDRTDAAFAPPVDAGFSDYRALALARLDPLAASPRLAAA